ncbi:Cell wall endopeptidase, family M23/M37 [Chitinispirillum alkaliphilum]|nr:Cell wall endopeptidase, family M23/M37 [Chitinispirillum alkaliphilum]
MKKKTTTLAFSLIVFSFVIFRFYNPSVDYSDQIETELSQVQEYLDSLYHEIEMVEKEIAYLHRTRHGSIRPGQGMFQALDDMGISNPMSLQIVNALRDTVELINLRAGEKFEILMDPDDSTKISSFSYSPNPAVVHRLEADSTDELMYVRIDHPTTIRYNLYQDTLKQGSSLDQALRGMGIPGPMVGVVNGVLLCKVPFRTHARAGDQFRILLKETFFQDSIRIDGKVLYAYYSGTRTGTHEAFRYEDFDPKSTFTAHYTEDGEALIHSGLRYPLDRLHISSPYGMRRHPITGRRTMHWGVDYRAPTGTPVYAVADGIVVKSRYNNINGNYIAIRHSDNYTSYYLHLHRRNVRTGQRVRVRQVIGTVGSTGRSTGPHLHFGFKRPNGRWMDPLTKRMIATPKLEGDRLARFQEQVVDIREILNSVDYENNDATIITFDR